MSRDAEMRRAAEPSRDAEIRRAAEPSRPAIVLVTGGGRSGKSSYAQRLVEALPGPRVFLATATPFDPELEERIANHRQAREEGGWAATIEEPFDLAQAIRKASGPATILVDCLTMWVGNLMWVAERDESVASAPTETGVASLCEGLLAAAREHTGTTVFVTNEVGLGIIPENPAARSYRDLLGRCNQVMAAGADVVVLMISGLPIALKGGDPLAAAGATGDYPGGAS